MDYKNVNDYEVIYMINEKNDYYLDLMFKKYYPLINKTADKYIEKYSYLNVDINDLIEEGNIVLNKSINSYNDFYNVKFITYFTNNLERYYITYFNRLIKKKHFRNISLDEIGYDISVDSDECLQLLSVKETYIDFKYNLSFMDGCILELTCNGFKPIEISKLLDISIKSIRTRQYRIRKKAKEITT